MPFWPVTFTVDQIWALHTALALKAPPTTSGTTFIVYYLRTQDIASGIAVSTKWRRVYTCGRCDTLQICWPGLVCNRKCRCLERTREIDLACQQPFPLTVNTRRVQCPLPNQCSHNAQLNFLCERESQGRCIHCSRPI